MKNDLLNVISEAAKKLNIESSGAVLSYPDNASHGDYSTAIALSASKTVGMKPLLLAEKLVSIMKENLPEYVESVQIAGPGFINFKIKDAHLASEVVKIANDQERKFGFTDEEKGKMIMVEHTDPNAFKAFHIGHVMANAIGESISRLSGTAGAKVVSICYPADIGLQIAKSIWAIKKNISLMPADDAPIQERTAFLGKMYVEGTNAYVDPVVKEEIDELNKAIYEKSDPEINALYEKGRKWSLDHFELLYKRLGTKYDEYLFESDMAKVGLEIVKSKIGKGVFEESEGAVVFKGEDHGLHTRVFINSIGLPTYETKEVGLNVTKFKNHPDADLSVIVTANEQNDYFKVLIKVLSLIEPEVGSKTKHIGHGMLRFASGKMSSRTGNVIPAEDLLAEIGDMIREKIAGRDLTEAEVEEISDVVAVSAIKYTVLRQAIGGNVIFDSAASISFQGDSGPYLQYSAVRAGSVIDKAEKEGVNGATPDSGKIPNEVGTLERMIIRFPDIVKRSREERAPSHVAGYLTELAGAFNSYYASQIIVDKSDPLSAYRVSLVKAFRIIMENGLYILGIKVPRKM